MVRARRLCLLALVAFALALAAPGGAGAFVIGIGDQTPDVFYDPRFLALGIGTARLSVPWDVFHSRPQTRALDRWLRAARADGISPLISFDHHLPSSHGHPAPSAGAFTHEFRVFRARYPWVRDFAAWNEANHCGEPTCHRPGLVAAYYRGLRRVCPTCTILGAELLDEPGMIAWVRAYDRALGGEPAIWGLHNYLGANRLQTASTVSLLRATHSELWFTETGGVVARHNASRAAFPQSPRHAAAVTAFIFGRLAGLSPRITHVYLYQWNAGPGRQTWDSGLVGPEPRFAARPAFATLVQVIAARTHSPLTPTTAAALVRPGTILAGGLFGPGGPAALGAGPFAGTVQLRDDRSGQVVATETVAAGQRFAIAVAPGRYTLTGVRALGPAAGGSFAPLVSPPPGVPGATGVASTAPCGAVRATVTRGRGVVANVTCAATGG